MGLLWGCNRPVPGKPQVDAGRPGSGVVPLTCWLFVLQQVSSQPIRDTKVEVIRFAKDLLQHLRKNVRHGKWI